jgi:hypothetical protein
MSNVAGSSAAPDERRRLTLMRAFAADPTVQTFVGPSRSGICVLCGLAIKPNDIAYEIVAAKSAMTVEVNCYTTFMHETARSSMK